MAGKLPGLCTVLAALLGAGLDAAQLSRLADLRIRVRSGAFADDGFGMPSGNPAADRRLEFARWLVRSGRRHERID
jgi:hypothetical protein